MVVTLYADVAEDGSSASGYITAASYDRTDILYGCVRVKIYGEHSYKDLPWICQVSTGYIYVSYGVVGGDYYYMTITRGFAIDYTHVEALEGEVTALPDYCEN